MSQLIFIGGPPGVGKTRVARQLFDQLDSCAWLDGDDVWRIRPWAVTEATRQLAEDNIVAVLGRYLDAGYVHVLLSWVLHRQVLITRLAERLTTGRTGTTFTSITLLCDEAVLSERWAADGRGAVSERAHQRLIEARALSQTHHINTSGWSVEAVVEAVLAHTSNKS